MFLHTASRVLRRAASAAPRARAAGRRSLMTRLRRGANSSTVLGFGTGAISTVMATGVAGLIGGGGLHVAATAGRAFSVQAGDEVTVTYVGTQASDGEEFDSGEGLTFVIGGGNVIDGFDQGVQGMTIGETKEVDVTPEQGYGDPNPELVFEVKRDQLPEDVKVGDRLGVGPERRPAQVVELGEESAKLDMNHPLSGKALKFKITLTGRVDAKDVKAKEGELRLEELSPGDGKTFPS